MWSLYFHKIKGKDWKSKRDNSKVQNAINHSHTRQLSSEEVDDEEEKNSRVDLMPEPFIFKWYTVETIFHIVPQNYFGGSFVRSTRSEISFDKS